MAGDNALWHGILDLMHRHSADYTRTFRMLSALKNHGDEKSLIKTFKGDEAAIAWIGQWQKRTLQEGNLEDREKHMKAINPKYILRNWVAEAVIRAAEDRKDYTLLSKMLRVLQNPYDEHTEFDMFAQPPPSGTPEICVSCSS